MTNTKMTVAEMFAQVREIVVASEGEDSTLVAFIEKRAEMAAKRNTNRKPTKTQIENEGIKEQILELLSNADSGMRNGDIATALNISPNKVSALLSQLRKSGNVKREYDKKVAYFSIGVDAEYSGE